MGVCPTPCHLSLFMWCGQPFEHRRCINDNSYTIIISIVWFNIALLRGQWLWIQGTRCKFITPEHWNVIIVRWLQIFVYFTEMAILIMCCMRNFVKFWHEWHRNNNNNAHTMWNAMRQMHIPIADHSIKGTRQIDMHSFAQFQRMHFIQCNIYILYLYVIRVRDSKWPLI